MLDATIKTCFIKEDLNRETGETVKDFFYLIQEKVPEEAILENSVAAQTMEEVRETYPKERHWLADFGGRHTRRELQRLNLSFEEDEEQTFKDRKVKFEFRRSCYYAELPHYHKNTGKTEKVFDVRNLYLLEFLIQT